MKINFPVDQTGAVGDLVCQRNYQATAVRKRVMRPNPQRQCRTRLRAPASPPLLPSDVALLRRFAAAGPVSFFQMPGTTLVILG